MTTDDKDARGRPPVSEPKGETIRNWNNTVSCELMVHSVTPGYDPEHATRQPTPAEQFSALQAIVQEKGEYPTPLRAVGSLHSLNECFTTTKTGTIIRMEKFKEKSEHTIVKPGIEGSITVGAGVTMIELRDKLGDDWQIAVVPEIGNATAGSVACCGTKDASLGLGPDRFGQISSTVTGVKMINAQGQIEEVTEENDRALKAIRSSYGLLGIVFEVTFKTIPRRTLNYDYQPFHVDSDLTIDRILLKQADGKQADGFLAFLMPYSRTLVAERRTVVAEAKITPFDWATRRVRDFAWKHIGSVNVLERHVWVRDLDSALATFLTNLHSFEALAGSSMIDFPRKPEYAFDFAFWAFPRRAWTTAIPEYLKFCDRFLSETGFRSALPTEVYFIRKDDSALLSFCPDEDIFTLDLVDIVPRSPDDEDLWRTMNEQFNEFAASHGARPLLNQTKFLYPDHMRMLIQHYRERWAEFAKLQKEKDPGGRFLTPYFRNLLEALPG
jgi:hypothetical protein